MAQSLDPDTQAQLDELQSIDRGMVLFDFPSGLYGFWTGVGPFSYGGVTYQGAGRMIGVEAIGQVTDGSAVPVAVTIADIPNALLSPDIIAAIEAETYHQRPVTIFTAYLDPDDMSLLSVEREYRGKLDKITHKHRVGGTAQITASIESMALDHLKTGYRMSAHEDQLRISGSDGFFKNTVRSRTYDLEWGQAPPKKVRHAA